MSNLQPSSSASEGDMWLYALHDKYLPASERFRVIDNVLVVWLPSLDVCKIRKQTELESKLNFVAQSAPARSFAATVVCCRVE